MTGEADKWRFDDGRRIEVSLGDVDLISVFAREHLTDDKRHEPEWEACKRLRRLVDDAFSDAPVLPVSEKPDPDPRCLACDGTGVLSPGVDCGCSEPSEKPDDPVEALRERIAQAIETATRHDGLAPGHIAFWRSSCDRDRRLKQADAVLAVREGSPGRERGEFNRAVARAEKAEAERDEAIRHVRALMEQELVPGNPGCRWRGRVRVPLLVSLRRSSDGADSARDV